MADLAIGAPNAETVLVYKAYPVVRVIARLVPELNEIDIDAKWLKFRACWLLLAKHDMKCQTTSKQYKIFLKDIR